MPTTILLLISAYLLGSIPFGVIIAKLRGVDLQQVGSGNTGATNVFRALGLPAAVFVFFLDGLKGYLACWLLQVFTEGNPWFIAGAAVCVMVGHTYSIFLKGKGGKGAATGVGILLQIAPGIGVIAVILTVTLIFLTRYVSVTSLVIAAVLPILFYTMDKPLAYLVLSVFGGLFVWLKHIPNIKRLLAGTENKVGCKQP